MEKPFLYQQNKLLLTILYQLYIGRVDFLNHSFSLPSRYGDKLS